MGFRQTLSLCTLLSLFSLKASANTGVPIGPLYARQIDQNDKDYYLGYRDADRNTSWAKYFNDTPPVLSREILSGLAESPHPSSLGVNISAAPEELDAPGYSELENGFAVLEDGSMTLTIRSDVPSTMTGEMLDFWFSWHTNETSKYKIWNPTAHQYAAINPLPHEKASRPSYRDRYINVTSFVDEYIGNTPYKLSIGFVDPASMGFSTSTKESGVLGLVSAFVTLLTYAEEDLPTKAEKGFTPLSAVLVHQLRKKPDGSGNEVRSRFWFGDLLVLGMNFAGGPKQLAHDLSVHCANEMTHLGTFLPALFEEFKDDVATGY
ncbi:hypothetical protein ASPWEDRAFT_186877 [Aspergillus wentii DTO 134E9]|uniref:DAPG hydrolase PhiG domain-containing protein n=1 Tax=Aspergillus wentii DTO 134E9 TaxID=1073089 RepID=A0A1L9R7L0_ASPWE|nr:uncharacterized protein ASPWEDRAFT_186877 [Aspergillus wentii DTO 134E9]KAI9927539.1 hypothetical protein MW887_003157 [Aspergillus wentii]OJJ30915.1 hypothetical protein ASPWEDRAFT_186877 [Aspergillus wentii DTO 134E9]